MLAGMSTQETGAPPELTPDGLPAQDESGVDLTLVRRMLSLTPLERLRELKAFERFVASVRARNPGLAGG